MKPPSDLIDTLNSTEWRKPNELSASAEVLIQEFLDKMRAIIKDLVATEGIKPGEAFDTTRTAGFQSETHRQLVADLFSHVTFRGAGVRETIILPIVSYYSWDEDPQLSRYPNPWTPLIELYKEGYTTDFDMDPDWLEIRVMIGYDNTEASFQLV